MQEDLPPRQTAGDMLAKLVIRYAQRNSVGQVSKGNRNPGESLVKPQVEIWWNLTYSSRSAVMP